MPVDPSVSREKVSTSGTVLRDSFKRGLAWRLGMWAHAQQLDVCCSVFGGELMNFFSPGQGDGVTTPLSWGNALVRGGVLKPEPLSCCPLLRTAGRMSVVTSEFQFSLHSADQKNQATSCFFSS